VAAESFEETRAEVDRRFDRLCEAVGAGDASSTSSGGGALR